MNLREGAHIHLIAACGTAMGSLAAMLSEKGYRVTGSDAHIYPPMSTYLREIGIELFEGFAPENLQTRPDLIVVGNAISRGNPELEAALDAAIPYTSLPEVLRDLFIRGKRSVVVTGTHGKTSTTALLAHIFHYNERNASYIFGGITSFHGIGGHYGDQDQPIILETDEAFNTFKDINIDDLLVTNIDVDHLDYFKNFKNLLNAFKHVIENVKGNLVLNFDDQNLRELKTSNNCISYSSSEIADIQIQYPNKIIIENEEYVVTTKLIGNHFISNIAGAIALAYLNGIKIEDSIEAVETFPGVKRRTEYLGSIKGIKLYDDYGHHPTEIAATISALKENTIGKLYVIFQPHRYTRTKNGFEDFRASLSKADETIVVDIYPAGEEPIPGVSSKNFENKKIKYLKSMRMVPSYLSTRVTENDIILTLGAGDITLLGPQILKYLDEI